MRSGSGADANSGAWITDVTSRIKDMTVEEIVTMWNQGTSGVRSGLPIVMGVLVLLADLEDHIRAFSTQALEVKRRDELLRENAKQVSFTTLDSMMAV